MKATPNTSRRPARDGLTRHPFFFGMGSVLDLSGNGARLPAPAPSPSEADKRALESDWLAVAGDFRTILDAP